MTRTSTSRATSRATTRAWKDLALGGAALLAFPLALHLTAWTADGHGPTPEDPLWQRGGQQPVHSAGR